MHPTASPLVTLGIGGIAVAVALAAVVLHGRAAERAGARAPFLGTTIAVAAWLTLTGVVGASGALLDADARPPRFAVMFVVVLGAGVGIAASRFGRALAELPLWLLVSVQAFRLPLEIVMHAAAGEGTMPSALSFRGYNFDVVTGASALVLGLALRTRDVPLWVVRSWNALGIAALTVIAGIALLTSPALRALGPDQVNDWVAYFPFTWLPTVLVVAAIAGHGVVLRALRLEAARRARSGSAGDGLSAGSAALR